MTGADTIELSRFKFDGLNEGDLRRSAFTIDVEATTERHRIIYDDDTGSLFFDVDGTGDEVAVRFARLAQDLQLGADDFNIF